MKFFFGKKLFSMMVILLLASIALVGCSGSKSASGGSGKSNGVVTLKLAHQFASASGDKGDYRSQLADKFAKEVEKRSNGSIKVEVYPADSLLKGTEQFSALQKGSLDMAIYLPFYDSGKVKDFSISLMPGIIKNSEQAWKWPGSKVGEEVENLMMDNGIKMLVWTWAPTTVATSGKKVVEHPKDVAGLKVRGAGSDSEEMFKDLGAGIVSMPSSELYSALQSGVLDGTLTSYSSFMSYRLFEVVDNFLYPGDNAMMYALMPLVISKDVYENKLTDDQKKVIDEVSNELQEWVVGAVEKDNEMVVQTFKEHGANIYEISPDQAGEWFEAAQPIVKKFEKSSERAKKLIEAARELH